MIVTRHPDELRLITQPDHARFAAQLLALWHRTELREHPRRELLLEAVREHDNGWLEADAAPRVDPASGRPYDFRSLPEEHRREIWLRGVERFAGEAPYVALLAARHSLELLGERQGWREYREALDTRRLELLAATGLGETELAEDYPWLELADSLSLAVCGESPEPVRRGGLTAWPRPGELRLEPFPLAGATTFEIPCRRIADRPYGGDAELASALAKARWSRIAVRCRPHPGG